MSITGSQIHDCYEHHELETYEKSFHCEGCLMDGFGERYTCNRCGRELHKECRDPKSQVSHKNFVGSVFKLYDKPFTRSDKKNGKEFSKCCNACGQDIRGINYHCEEGNLDLHPYCAKLEKELEIDGMTFDLVTKVSSECRQCGMKKKFRDEEVQGWSYVSQCRKIHFHVSCIFEKKVEAQRQRPSPVLPSTVVNDLKRRVVTATSKKMSITGSQIHGCYEHYELKTCAKLFQCEGCKMNGFGERYTCNPCGCELHKECRYHKPEVSHENFVGSVFKFYDKPFTKKNCKEFSKCCNACRQDIRGFNYHCEENNLDLHPCCARLEKKKLTGGKIFDLVTEVSSMSCGKCGKKKFRDEGVQGWSYVSQCKKYHFHVYCMSEMVQEAYMKHGDMALEKMDLSELVGYKRNRGGENTVLAAIKLCVEIFLSAILGDPTMLISNLAVELFSRGLQL